MGGGAGLKKPGGALLGPEKSGGPVGWQGDAGFLWLFGCWIVDASIFVAVLLKTSACLLGGLGVLFCCVCVCGDKL